jgi:hypothetical protein
MEEMEFIFVHNLHRSFLKATKKHKPMAQSLHVIMDNGLLLGEYKTTWRLPFPLPSTGRCKLLMRCINTGKICG